MLGVIDAANPAQLDAALQQLAGGLSGPILALRDRLLDLVAHLEANLDFTEEPDVDPLGRAALADELDRSAAELAGAVAGSSPSATGPRAIRASSWSDRPTRARAGSSTPFSAGTGRSSRPRPAPPATTSRSLCDCDGLTVELVDTAGIEAAGRRRRSPGARPIAPIRPPRRPVARLPLGRDGRPAPRATRPRIVPGIRVWTKADLALPGHPATGSRASRSSPARSTGAGLDALRSAIARTLRSQEADGKLARRHRRPLPGQHRPSRGRAAIGRGDRSWQEGGDELVAFDLRLAVDELGKVVGAVVTDDILDRIFRRFCIGK